MTFYTELHARNLTERINPISLNAAAGLTRIVGVQAFRQAFSTIVGTVAAFYLAETPA